MSTKKTVTLVIRKPRLGFEKKLTIPREMESMVKAVFFERKHLFLHGFGGTGKSYRIRFLREFAQSIKVPIAVTSTTGISSINVEGVTIHSWSCLGYARGTTQELIQKISRNGKEFLLERLFAVKLIVIDEVSMLHGKTLDKIDAIFRHFTGCNRPFGGKQMIFSGDVLQLPPVEPKKKKKEPVDYFFRAKVWRKLLPEIEGHSIQMKIMNLTTPYRYLNEKETGAGKRWHRLLMRVRKNKMLSTDHGRLMERFYTPSEIEELFSEKKETFPTRLLPTRKQVDTHNKMRLHQLKSPLATYTGYDCSFSQEFGKTVDWYATPTDTFIETHSVKQAHHPDYVEWIAKQLDKEAPRELKLKNGAQVMLVVNRLRSGLANGSQGTIVGIRNRSVLVRFDRYPKKTFEIKKAPFYILKGGTYFIRYQIPLILSWALTIHRCQGCTLDKAVIDLSRNVFAPSQAYVALSRVKSYAGVYLLRYTHRSIKVDPDALKYASFLEELGKEEGV